ncbi:MAG: hypothetical protein A3A33_01615 [Candidatus Yanofskybacteria bacterium RIFCSPLOWO2_01_FULL_49_25]|uniref:APS kinase domain-containing protein n=1 Tax=Candidatus Yanofskybacteria bacterium RIFCSPLOWO2_01_FULL_49_25 TaxID=1802701 RepID=A0A1F8GX47_9BACT|nr:MAG: hypothetical protein A3A33_01615 [Candidatus Yanofskybacteria bacterium RIFCSPLOWO2_01_FULL_49_25]
MHKKTVIWITGLPGTGKTTLAKKVFSLIRLKVPAVFIDGDAVRKMTGNDLGYSVKDRIKNAYRISRLCKLLSDQGLVVVCATVSLFKEIHTWNRRNMPGLFEVFIDTPAHILHQRDRKKLYTKSKAGKITDLVGIHQSYDVPRDPHLIISNSQEKKNLLKRAQLIVESLRL